MMALRSTPSSRVKFVSFPPSVGAGPDVGDGKVGGFHLVAFAQQHGALDFVLQLADVARPVKRGKPLNGFRLKPRMSRLACAANRFRKALASGMMSSRRSRSGGR